MNDPNAPGGQPPASPPPPPPPSGQQGWQSSPQPPGQPPMGGQPSGMPSWTNNLMARGTVAGPGGVALADTTTRFIAWVIDAIIIGIVGYIVTTITTSVLGDNLFGGIFGLNYKVPSIISVIVAVVVMLAATFGYFWYTWMKMGGATIGQRVMKLSVRDSASGGPMSQNQVITRWALLGAPLAVYWGLYGWNIFTWLVWLLVVVWNLYLAYTIAQSPTRQGMHDTYAKTVVAKV